MLRTVTNCRYILIQAEMTYLQGSSSALEVDVAHIVGIHP